MITLRDIYHEAEGATLHDLLRNRLGASRIAAPDSLAHRFFSEGPDSVHDMLDHLEHIAAVVGMERVGVGHDNFVHPDESHFRVNDRIGFATGTSGLEGLMPAEALPGPERRASYLARLEGFEGISGWPNLTRGLVAPGYTDAEIEGVLGGNWLRLFASFWYVDDTDVAA